uniref:non-specific serine/threonine protein kinase n=1 Tax=Davidia involucrata TaxID=16924 RepID=A0A5B6YWA6_DAVIN
MKFPVFCSNCFSSSSDIIVANQSGHGGQTAQNFHVFSSNELKAATNGFRSSNKIGEGGFGSVYKGRLKDGTMVAVKVLSVELESMRGEREFISEIAALSNIRHENLVTLRGCCVDGADRFLVYDYMENNSLAHSFLGGEQNRIRFSWSRRRDISLGVARGLAYLHEEVNPHVVHRDIKAGNILLDQNFAPKVSDFGLSKLFRDNISHISTRVAGTFFGVLLLEIVSGRSVVDFDLEHGERFLVDKAWEMYNANNLLQLVDPVLKGEFLKEEAIQFLKVGLLCVQETTSLRPRMSAAVKMLANETNIEDVKISQPGLVADLMDVKIGQGHSSYSIFSKASTSNG